MTINRWILNDSLCSNNRIFNKRMYNLYSASGWIKKLTGLSRFFHWVVLFAVVKQKLPNNSSKTVNPNLGYQRKSNGLIRGFAYTSSIITIFQSVIKSKSLFRFFFISEVSETNNFPQVSIITVLLSISAFKQSRMPDGILCL